MREVRREDGCERLLVVGGVGYIIRRKNLYAKHNTCEYMWDLQTHASVLHHETLI